MEESDLIDQKLNKTLAPYSEHQNEIFKESMNHKAKYLLSVGREIDEISDITRLSEDEVLALKD